ncbi:MAG: MATE family efflux transporter, partial [Lachnospiraceae bacterium]|nr:MATE family efflux transporter [Lachnospiraceae bacterium]
LGSGNKENASRGAAQLISLSALLGLFIMAVSIIFRRLILGFFFGSITEEVMEAALLYFLITALSFPFLAAYNAGAAIFRSAGNSAISMRVSMFMNIFNVAGNAVCVFMLHMGVAGVAIPTLIARALGAAIILYLASSPGAGMHIRPADTVRLDPATVKRILNIGIPSGIENSLFQLGRVTVVSMISTFGTIHIAANAVANNLDQVGIIVGMSMGLAMITVIGRAVGAQDERQVRMYMKKLLIWTYIGQNTVELLILILMPQLLKLYSLSPETSSLTTTLVRIHLLNGIFLWPTAFTLPNALRAANDIRYTMTVSVLSMLIWRIGFSYILCIRMGMGAVGVWVAMIIDWICRFICFVWRWRSGRWKRHCGLDTVSEAAADRGNAG